MSVFGYVMYVVMAYAEGVGSVASRRVQFNATIRQKPPRFCRKGALGASRRVAFAGTRPFGESPPGFAERVRFDKGTK